MAHVWMEIHLKVAKGGKVFNIMKWKETRSGIYTF